ncbi:MAG: hypothetical protein JRN62_02585 [Nitrososphaerota archaeon]|nr:hypothetical protein [Nitrososphaerota archaeon]MDG6948889.1 hypothetical protein [Nitrososphaerota archaeon]
MGGIRLLWVKVFSTLVGHDAVSEDGTYLNFMDGNIRNWAEKLDREDIRY